MKNIPDDNAPVFRKAQKLIEAEGYEVISPLDVHCVSINHQLAEDLRIVCLEAYGVIVLPGWELSGGARAEVATALRLIKPVWELGIFLLMSDDSRHGPGNVKTVGIGSYLK